ncbi:MAG: hypothetical protein KAX65_00030 [Caldilineaceae bacterium]|nr:hypothetical protein [Caldilineaceae bacterium]
MNTSTLQYILDRYDPENDYAPISNADAALLEMVIDLVERVQELEAMLKPAPALVQPTMFPDGEDAPLFTLPEDPADQDRQCSRCNRHPAESGKAHWLHCPNCNDPVCDTCGWQDADGRVFCGPSCLMATN